MGDLLGMQANNNNNDFVSAPVYSLDDMQMQQDNSHVFYNPDQPTIDSINELQNVPENEYEANQEEAYYGQDPGSMQMEGQIVEPEDIQKSSFYQTTPEQDAFLAQYGIVQLERQGNKIIVPYGINFFNLPLFKIVNGDKKYLGTLNDVQSRLNSKEPGFLNELKK